MGCPVHNIYDYRTDGDRIAPRPITPDDMINHLKLDPSLSGDPTFESEMNAYIDYAIATAEQITKRVIQETKFLGFLDYFNSPRQVYEIRKSPLTSFLNIFYTVNGVEQTLDTALYYIADNLDFSRIQPILGASWPSTDRIMHSIRFEFFAGYQEDGVPPDLLLALKNHVSAMWANRGDCEGSTTGSSGCMDCPVPATSMLTYQLYRIIDLRIGL